MKSLGPLCFMDTTTESPPGNGNGVRQDADPETDRLGRGYPALDLLANGNPELGIIELTRGLVTIVDAEDFAWLSQWRWHAQGRDRWIYAVRSFIDLSGKPGLVLMHREIAGTGRGQSTDHINGDTLDNRRANLRTCSHSENMCNRAHSNR